MSQPPVPIDRLPSSPVRGQLDPYDRKTEKGWRYIQLTDTHDELKMLLPPGTAAMYEQLLKFENYELSKRTTLSLERIVEIRHLKDRMIRKCRKLAKTTPAVPKIPILVQGQALSFQTFVAPPDFRVKAIEKWFRDQQKRANAVVRKSSTPTRSTSMAPPCTCSRCVATARADTQKRVPDQGPPLQLLSSSTGTQMQRSVTNPEPKQRSSTYRSYAKSQILANDGPSNSVRTSSANVASMSSPRPLPILLRGQRAEFGLEMTDDPDEAGHPLQDLESEFEGDDSPASPPSQEGALARPGRLSRRRSCIKRASLGDIAKTVSWADDQEWDQQLSKYTAAAREAQASGKWEEVRDLYMQQITGLESLHTQVAQGLEHLRFESEHLQRVDETIRLQRESLHATFQEFEQNQTLFQEKVQEAMQVATDVLARHGLKRELHAIDEV